MIAFRAFSRASSLSFLRSIPPVSSRFYTSITPQPTPRDVSLIDLPPPPVPQNRKQLSLKRSRSPPAPPRNALVPRASAFPLRIPKPPKLYHPLDTNIIYRPPGHIPSFHIATHALTVCLSTMSAQNRKDWWPREYDILASIGETCPVPLGSGTKFDTWKTSKEVKMIKKLLLSPASASDWDQQKVEAFVEKLNAIRQQRNRGAHNVTPKEGYWAIRQHRDSKEREVAEALWKCVFGWEISEYEKRTEMERKRMENWIMAGGRKQW